MAELSVYKEIKDKIAIIRPVGHIDTDTFSILKDEIKNTIKSDQVKVIIDMSGVTFISSAGWGTITGSIQSAKQAGGNIKIAGMLDEAKNVYELIELNELVDAYNTVDEALSSFIIK